MGGGRSHRPIRARILPASLAALVVLVVCLLVGGATFIGARGGSGASGLPSVRASEIPGNCSDTELAHLALSPASVAVLPLKVEIFSVAAENGCGTPLAVATSFAWWLSSISVGALNATTGASVAYTACVAPMGGVLHVKAMSGEVTLFANASITVSGQGSSGGSPAPGAPGGSLGSGGASSPALTRTEGIALISGCFLGAALILYLGRRNRPRGNHEF
jgi:hypothetical protein